MNISEECFKEIVEMVEALIEEADHHANSKNPVVKITDKNYQVASGKSLPGPFNKNHVGQYIVYNKDTDASYLVTPDNWKKSKIKRDLERQGKFYEALEEAISALLEYTEADKKKAAKKVLDDRKREYLSKYANVLDAADIDGSDNVPDGDMKDLERAEKRYKHAKKVANEALEETLKILELFDRPDLLNDIDTALGSPIKKTFKKVMGSIVVPKKEKKITKKKVNENFDNLKEISYNIEEALSLIEAIINEVSSNFTVPKIVSKEKEVKELIKKEGETADPVEKKKLANERVKLEHKLNVTKGHVFNYHANQLKREETKRNAEKNKE